METKNLLKSLKRRLGLITAILAMLLVSQGAFAWGWIVRNSDKQSSENPSVYLGDWLTLWWCFDGTASGATYKRACISNSSSSAGTWQDNVQWESDSGCGDNNKLYSASFQTTSTGTRYYSLWLGWGSSVGTNGRYYKGSNSWNEGSESYTSSSFTVTALPNVTKQSATAKNASQIDLSWTQNSTKKYKKILQSRIFEIILQP